MMTPDLTPDGFFELAEGREDLEGIFVLGSFEDRVSIRHQQVRALNLIYCLRKSGRLNEGSRVAVIGGGIAGMTSAAAALSVGVRVELFEEKQSLMWMQRPCRHRWVHPNIYDWPSPGALEEDAGLPLLNWKAAYAHDVVRQIDEKWNAIASTYVDQLSVRMSVADVDVLPAQHEATQKICVNWSKGTAHHELFDFVILAVGFGIEPRDRYWEGDNLDSETLRGQVLISGCGDGGHADLRRVLLRGYQHEEILSRISSEDLRRVTYQIDEIERTARTADDLEHGYRNLEVDSVQAVLRSIESRDVDVTLTSSASHPYSMKASVLNRFILSQLLKSQRLRYLAGPIVVQDNGLTVEFRSSGLQQSFDRIICRHGPVSALHRSFPKMATRFETWFGTAQKKLPAALDRTRWPMWEAEFYPPPPGQQRRASPAPGADVRHEELYVVVGAGVVGAAVARRLIHDGKNVRVIERETAPGRGLSLRNSQIIHAGIYYTPGSLKAQLCVEGRRAIYEYCKTRPTVRHNRCGKLIVASGPGEVGRLEEFFQRATENGVENLRMLSASGVRSMEPDVEAEAAIYSPESGIISVADLVREFLREVGLSRLELGKEVRRVRREATGLYVEFGDGEAIRCDYLINCAGLAAQQVALSIDDFPTDQVPPLYPAKGNYCWLPGPSPFKHLVYPVPSDDGGLGVHATLTLDDREILFGPDVEWRQDLGAKDLCDYGSTAYEVHEATKTKFLNLVARYYPGINARSRELKTKWAAFRPRLYGEDAEVRWADFMVSTEDDHGVRGVVNLFGIESPGMTASLALADYVVAGMS